MNPPPGEAVRRSPDWLWPAVIGLGLALVAWQIVTAGSWLDEYWQLWISGAPTSELAVRLKADAHPPWFNLLARPIVLATGGQIIPARLVNLFAAVAVLAAGLWRMRALDPKLRWRVALLLLASGGAVGMFDLATSFRVYAWLLVLSGLQAALLAMLLLKKRVPMVLTVAVTASSIAAHYVHSAGAIAIALTSLFVAWRNDRSALRPIACGLFAGVALNLITGLIQLPGWRVNYDVNWIADSGGGAASAFRTFGVDFVVGNFVTAVLLALAVIRRKRAAMAVLAPIPIAVVGWLLLDSVTHMVVPRYLASATALLATAAAVGWVELGLSAFATAAISVLAVLQPLVGSVARPPRPGWEAGARIAARALETCPEAKLYAVSAWRFRDQPNSMAARLENPVFGFAYRDVGRRFGLNPKFVTGPTSLDLGPCPAIVWMEAAHGIEAVSPEAILGHAQLRLPSPARARVVPTANGAVLLISPVDRLQPRP